MHKILLAEDDRSLRYNLEHFLISEGYEVFPAENGSAAYDLAVENKPELIITDVHMPVMTGLELSEKLKENCETAGIPMVFITSDTSLVDEFEKHKRPIKNYLIKPFNLNDLLDLVLENSVNDE